MSLTIAKITTLGAAGQTTMLMRSVGSNVYMHFSKPARGHSSSNIKPRRFDYDQNFWQEFNSDSFTKLNLKFHTGFYNGGYVKDLPIFQFFKAIDRGDEIKTVCMANSK